MTDDVKSTPDEMPVVFPEVVNRLVKVTPSVAMDYLGRSDLNRRMSRDRAVMLADAFRRGEYRVTGDSVVFSRYGFMNNGQHRMLGVIIADLQENGTAPDGRKYTDIYPRFSVENGYIALPFWVMEGADDDETMVQDTGRPRSFTDHLRISGVPSANVRSGVSKLLWHVREGTIRNSKDWQSRMSPTVIQLDSFYRSNGDLIAESVKRAESIRKLIPITHTVLAVSWILFSEIDRADAEGFWDALSMKSLASDIQPVQQLIRVILKKRKARVNVKTGREVGWYNSFDARIQMAYVIKAWNAYRDGREIENLTFRAGGVSPESFPQPH